MLKGIPIWLTSSQKQNCLSSWQWNHLNGVQPIWKSTYNSFESNLIAKTIFYGSRLFDELTETKEITLLKGLVAHGDVACNIGDTSWDKCYREPHYDRTKSLLSFRWYNYIMTRASKGILFSKFSISIRFTMYNIKAFYRKIAINQDSTTTFQSTHNSFFVMLSQEMASDSPNFLEKYQSLTQSGM